MNSPGCTSSETRSRATTSPYVFRTDSIETAPRIAGTRVIVDEGARARALAGSLLRPEVEARLHPAGRVALVVHALEDRADLPVHEGDLVRELLALRVEPERADEHLGELPGEDGRRLAAAL